MPVKKLEQPSAKQYDAMKRVVKMLGRALNAEVKNCPTCRDPKRDLLGPCRVCQPAKNVLAMARTIIRDIKIKEV